LGGLRGHRQIERQAGSWPGFAGCHEKATELAESANWPPGKPGGKPEKTSVTTPAIAAENSVKNSVARARNR
jgi:hypothetical protein